jgi:hypothetical protein
MSNGRNDLLFAWHNEGVDHCLRHPNPVQTSGKRGYAGSPLQSPLLWMMRGVRAAPAVCSAAVRRASKGRA